MVQHQTVLIEDTLHSDQLIEVIWGMMTDADIALNGQSALLRKNGWNLAAEIRAPRRAVFDIAPVHPGPGQAPNTGYRKLIVRLGDKVTDLDLSISAYAVQKWPAASETGYAVFSRVIPSNPRSIAFSPFSVISVLEDFATSRPSESFTSHSA